MDSPNFPCGAQFNVTQVASCTQKLCRCKQNVFILSITLVSIHEALSNAGTQKEVLNETAVLLLVSCILNGGPHARMFDI
jgi:hypothetical protein